MPWVPWSPWSPLSPLVPWMPCWPWMPWVTWKVTSTSSTSISMSSAVATTMSSGSGGLTSRSSPSTRIVMSSDILHRDWAANFHAAAEQVDRPWHHIRAQHVEDEARDRQRSALQRSDAHLEPAVRAVGHDEAAVGSCKVEQRRNVVAVVLEVGF